MLGVPRVARLAVRKLDRAAQRELREVQLAQEDAAGGGEAGHDGRVVVGHVVGQDARARRGAHAARVELVLHRERDAVQRPERDAARDVVLRVSRGRQRRLAADRDVGAQAAVQPVDPLQVRARELDRGELLVADQRGLAGRAQEQDVVAHGPGC